MCVCVGLWWSLYFQELLLQLHDLPFALLGMIGEFDGDPEQGEAASALQTACQQRSMCLSAVLRGLERVGERVLCTTSP